MRETSVKTVAEEMVKYILHIWWFGFKGRDLNATVANSFSTDGSTDGSYLVFVFPENLICQEVSFLDAIAFHTISQSDKEVRKNGFFLEFWTE